MQKLSSKIEDDQKKPLQRNYLQMNHLQKKSLQNANWRSALDLDFEAPHFGPWQIKDKGFDVETDMQDKISGKQSLRFTSHRDDIDIGAAKITLPISIVRGKRIHLTGYLKAKDITSYGTLWIKADGDHDTIAYCDLGESKNLKGTIEWKSYSISLDIPSESTSVQLGAMMNGSGTLWVDHFAIQILQHPKDVKSTIHGKVIDSKGNAVANALVAICGNYNDLPFDAFTSDSDGRFKMKLSPGTYDFVASKEYLVATTQKYNLSEDKKSNPELILKLGDQDQGMNIQGRVVDVVSPKTMQKGYVALGDGGDHYYYTRPDEDGAFSINVPPRDNYAIYFVSDGKRSVPQALPKQRKKRVTIHGFKFDAPSDKLVAALKKEAIPLKTTLAENGFDDLNPLKKLVGDARIVALGESSHGTREIFQMKHRLLEFLVEKMGFTVFAIEANWPESLAVNDYVLNGRKDPKDSLAGMYFWVWDTEEVLQMIQWMRRFNADPKHTRKVKFYGFDMQFTLGAADAVVSYFKQVDPRAAAGVEHVLTPLRTYSISYNYSKVFSPMDQQRLRRELKSILHKLQQNKKHYIQKAGKRLWIEAKHHLRIIDQAKSLFGCDSSKKCSSDSIRDKSMAENTKWILDNEPPGTKMVLWAHNYHIQRHPPYFHNNVVNQGTHLARIYGNSYFTIGFGTNQGSFQARDYRQGGNISIVRKFSVGPTPLGFIESTLAKADLPIMMLPLRNLSPQSPVFDWAHEPHPMRSIGAVYINDNEMTRFMNLKRDFDAFIMIETASRARPNPLGRRPCL